MTVSQRTLQRRLKAHGFSFKRIKKRPAKAPNEREYRKAQRRLAVLHAQEQAGNLELMFADAAGFALGQVQHYAWQQKDEPLWIDVLSHRQRLNVIGFFSQVSTKQTFHSTVFEKSIDDRCMIAAVDDMLRWRTSRLPLVIVLDNAPYHHTEQMLEAQTRWKKRNVTIEYLPSYSPKLNTIELLWKFIKYYWLPLEAFYSFNNLRKHLYVILNGIGKEYRITFVN